MAQKKNSSTNKANRLDTIVIRPKQLIKDWCIKHNIKVKRIRHIHKHAYVIGYAAPLCLVVATCWMESEPQCKEFDKVNPLNTLHTFDKTLKPGDWCITGYICTEGRQETIAIPYGV
jgi:hypothetical protein